MRAINLTAAAAVSVLLCGIPLCRAQTAPTDKPSSPQSLTGPGGKDSRGRPASDKAASKAGEGVTKSDPKTHVNTLSPGEKRRAARARERAASKGKPAKKVEESSTKAVQPPPSSAHDMPPAPKQAAAPAPQPAAKQKSEQRNAASADLRRHARPPKSRSAVREPRWVPRVGAVVPRDVPLYDVPPGYRPGGYYVTRPPWRYVPGPGYPPFPRVGRAYPAYPRGDVDDFDDAY